MINDSAEKLFGKLNELYDEVYKTNLILVNNIIKSKSKNTRTIETILDTLLSCYDKRCAELFIILCNYYKTINYKTASIYMSYINKTNEDDMCEGMGIEFLINILMEDMPSESIRKNENEIFQMIPELSSCKDFKQKNIWHIYDVYEHILHVVDGVPNNLILRLAALFHDIGKPFVYTEDEYGVGHFYGHWNKSKEIFDRFIVMYNLDKNLKNTVSNLILYHDLNIDKISEEELDILINSFDKEGILMLFQLKKSDLLAQNKQFSYLLNDYERQKAKILKLKVQKK